MRECAKVKPLLVFYAYGDLSEEERHAVEEHIDSCESCRLELVENQRTVSLISRSVEMDLRLAAPRLEGLETRVYQGIARETLRSNHAPNIGENAPWWSFIWRPWIRVGYVVAALLIGIYIGSVLMPSSRMASEGLAVQEPDLAASNDYIQKRLESFVDQDAVERLQNARVLNYIKGDAQAAWDEYQLVINDNPDSYIATVAMEELTRVGYEP